MFSGHRSARMRALVILVAGALALSGCAANTAYDPGLSPAENQLRQSNARFNTTVAQGAGTGAVLGGLAGLALGGRNRGQAALIGAGAGALLGGGAGYLVARNNLNRASTEAQFNDAIQQASADADAYRNSAVASSQIADQAYADADRLRGQYASRQITKEQYRAGLSKYQSDLEILNSQAADARKTAAALRQDSRVASAGDRVRMTGIASDEEASSQRLSQQASRISRALAGADL